jgi:hypothetical protein
VGLAGILATWTADRKGEADLQLASMAQGAWLGFATVGWGGVVNQWQVVVPIDNPDKTAVEFAYEVLTFYLERKTEPKGAF